jgi:hypothetical protein
MSGNPKKSRLSGSLTGAAEVHFISGELSRLGYIALQTFKNTEGIDGFVRLEFYYNCISASEN